MKKDRLTDFNNLELTNQIQFIDKRLKQIPVSGFTGIVRKFNLLEERSAIIQELTLRTSN